MKLDFRIPNADELFNLNQTEHSALFHEIRETWSVLLRLGDYISSNLKTERKGEIHDQAALQGDVSIGEGSIIEPEALIIGHAVEIKNSLLFNRCKVPHFNYVGDSILGYQVHLGAGAILSNYRLIRGKVNVLLDGKKIKTAMEKFGVLVGDRTEIGCNSVLQPGTIIGKDCVLYSNINFGGVLPASRLVKSKNELIMVPREENGD
tara:strand:- start:955 stop:1572 length:618 start_codon:yes stop_codon:yes gene_type:complete